MCKYTFHQSSTCHRQYKDKDGPKTKNQPCQWIQIAQPCAWGAGLLSCPVFASNALRIDGPNIIRVTRKGCPRHDFGGLYDRNLVKMVEEVRTGRSWFGPPDMSPESRRVEKEKKVEKRGDVRLCIIM